LIKPGDDAGLADLLDQIFSEPEKYDHIRQTARMRAIEEFDWDKIIDRTIEIISQRLDGGNCKI
jgi:glycosyltransferase involved in cell wall biosynthesis